jgi:hypothetical protein
MNKQDNQYARRLCAWRTQQKEKTMRSLFNKYVFNLDWRRTGKMPTVVKLWRSIKDLVYHHCYYKHTKKHKQDLEDVSARVLAVRDRVLPHLTGSTPTNTKIMNKYEEKQNTTHTMTTKNKETNNQYYVEVVRCRGMEVVERMGPIEKRKAEQLDRGININISNEYMTQIVPA